MVMDAQGRFISTKLNYFGPESAVSYSHEFSKDGPIAQLHIMDYDFLHFGVFWGFSMYNTYIIAGMMM